MKTDRRHPWAVADAYRRQFGIDSPEDQAVWGLMQLLANEDVFTDAECWRRSGREK